MKEPNRLCKNCKHRETGIKEKICFGVKIVRKETEEGIRYLQCTKYELKTNKP